jgi:hypothetical protein
MDMDNDGTNDSHPDSLFKKIDRVFDDPCNEPDLKIPYSFTYEVAGGLTDSTVNVTFLSGSLADLGHPTVGSYQIIGAACECQDGNPSLKFMVNGALVGTAFGEGTYSYSQLGSISGSGGDQITIYTLAANGAAHCWISYRIFEKPKCP